MLPTYTVTTGTCEWEDSGTWGCPQINWEADTCDEWKDDWDYTLGGLFPYMTQDKFFDDIVGEDIDSEDCEEILEGNLFDF